MSNTIIVTMFIPLGRESWSGFERSDDDYINYFKEWAMIHNFMYIFTVPKYESKLLKIREDYGLKDKTKIIVFEDYLKCDEDLYLSIKKSMTNPCYINYRYNKNRPETQSHTYNYVMMLKYFCLKEVSEIVDSSNILVWHDFGWHYYNYDFNSSLNFSFIDKIQMYKVIEFDDNPIFNIIKWTKNYITGATIQLPCKYAKDFWHLMRESMLSLNRCGFCDQDQTILLMAYREKPDIFNIVDFKEYRDIFYSAIGKKNEYKEKEISIFRYKIHKFKLSLVNFFRRIKYALRQMYE